MYLDGDNRVMFEVLPDCDLTLSEFATFIRENADLKIGQLETQAGIEHPKFYNLEHGNYKSLMPLLVAMDYLGYTIEITQPQPQ